MHKYKNIFKIKVLLCWLVFLILITPSIYSEDTLKQLELLNSSFEEIHPPDKYGKVFSNWGGWKYEGASEFRLGKVSHSGKYSALLYGAEDPKIRISSSIQISTPGRYKICAYLRGLDIGVGKWNQTIEFMFNKKYMQLKKNGSFGWSKLSYVVDINEPGEISGPSFGLMATGYFWIDDVSIIKVSDDTPLTENPEIGDEEASLLLTLDEINAVRCNECSYKNSLNNKNCHYCGEILTQKKDARSLPSAKLISSFEDKKYYVNYLKEEASKEHATDGNLSLKLKKSYFTIQEPQNWYGYDYLKVDFYTPSYEPLDIYIEIRDSETKDYWTRVNINTIVPPGSSTLCLPIDQLYRGEKSRPGTKLILDSISHLIFNIGDSPKAPLYIDNVRLERDIDKDKYFFDGLFAFDLGQQKSPVMPGFKKITPTSNYNAGKGYGLKDAKIWRSFDVLQPDPLFQDFICIEKGGLAIDVPNGKYHVVINMDNPSGYWGEYQKYHERVVSSEWREMVKDRMNFESFKNKYYRFWNVEDTPNDDTFDKYQKAYFDIKEYDISVKDEQLNIDFSGENWACSVSSVIVFPAEKMKEGEAFLKDVENKRKFFFNNYFKRVLHKATGDIIKATQMDIQKGYIPFSRYFMDDVYYNDSPYVNEINPTIKAKAFPDEIEPLTLSIYPLKDLGNTSLTISDLEGPSIIQSSNISIGYVSYRISRKTMDGTVYSITPRLIIPKNSFNIKKGITRRFWLNIKVPKDTIPGLYLGNILIKTEDGEESLIPVEFEVFQGSLKDVDIPVGPWGYKISVPWFNEKECDNWNLSLTKKSLSKLKEYGFTSFSGMPLIKYLGFKNERPIFDFEFADFQMKLARENGFKMGIVNYNRIEGLNLFQIDANAMKKAGFSDYSKFIKIIFSEIQKHSDENNWLPVYWNLCDEPIGEGLDKAIDNASMFQKAFPIGPPFFTGATSFSSNDPADKHFLLGKELHIANLNSHKAESISLLHKVGTDWAFYNDANRWTYGIYMYKAVKEYNLKFRLGWHWNITAGDPYYALDCREDDYAWCNSTPDGSLVASVSFERIREGIDDYRYLLTLSNLADIHKDSEAKKVISKLLSSFELGERDYRKLDKINLSNIKEGLGKRCSNFFR